MSHQSSYAPSTRPGYPQSQAPYGDYSMPGMMSNAYNGGFYHDASGQLQPLNSQAAPSSGGMEGLDPQSQQMVQVRSFFQLASVLRACYGRATRCSTPCHDSSLTVTQNRNNKLVGKTGDARSVCKTGSAHCCITDVQLGCLSLVQQSFIHHWHIGLDHMPRLYRAGLSWSLLLYVVIPWSQYHKP